jgi:hypothetical protein
VEDSLAVPQDARQALTPTRYEERAVRRLIITLDWADDR